MFSFSWLARKTQNTTRIPIKTILKLKTVVIATSNVCFDLSQGERVTDNDNLSKVLTILILPHARMLFFDQTVFDDRLMIHCAAIRKVTSLSFSLDLSIPTYWKRIYSNIAPLFAVIIRPKVK